jgi:hypothetical protein
LLSDIFCTHNVSANKMIMMANAVKALKNQFSLGM